MKNELRKPQQAVLEHRPQVGGRKTGKALRATCRVCKISGLNDMIVTITERAPESLDITEIESPTWTGLKKF